MTFTEANFLKLFYRLRQIDFGGESGPAYPFGLPPTAAEIGAAIDQGALGMPLVFRKFYVEPLKANLDSIMRLGAGNHALLEALSGAVYQHGFPELSAPLQRLLAVVSNLFRSFLSCKRRAAANFPVLQSLPPLAVFQRNGALGPFTFPCTDINRYTGGTISVVSLPATYREHPLLWSTLAHETGGHDVIHADSSLLPELEAGAKTLFGGTPIGTQRKLTHEQALGLVWSYWMDEAAADVYAVLNMGPSFGLNLAVYFAAVIAQSEGSDKPTLHTSSGFDPGDPSRALAPHPVDLLRLSVIGGVVNSLEGLDRSRRDSYMAQIEAVAKLCAPDATVVKITGVIDAHAGAHIPIDLSIPLAEMADSARRVGAFVATARLKALGGNSIQNLETWDDFDESAATHIAELFAANKPAAAFGDDAQLLAGANLAAFDNPESYDSITKRLEEALDLSFAEDPYWAKIGYDRCFDTASQFDLGEPGVTLG